MRLQLNQLSDFNKIVIGQLYHFDKPTDEILVISHGIAVSLNSGRCWKEVHRAGKEYSIEELPITVHNVVCSSLKDLNIDTSKLF